MRKLLKCWFRFLTWLVRRAEDFSVLCLLSMLALVIVSVVLRYVFHRPLLWEFDGSRSFSTFTFFLMPGMSLMQRRLPSINIGIGRLPTRVQTFIWTIDHVIALVALSVAIYSFWTLTWSAIESPRSLDELRGFPFVVLPAAMLVGYSILFLVIATYLGFAIRNFIRGLPLDEAPVLKLLGKEE